VKALSPVASRKGSLEQQGAHDTVGGTNHALSRAVLWGRRLEQRGLEQMSRHLEQLGRSYSKRADTEGCLEQIWRCAGEWALELGFGSKESKQSRGRSRSRPAADRRGGEGLDAGSAWIDAEVSTRGRRGSMQRQRSRRGVGADR
jgi:hypothetical protein